MSYTIKELSNELGISEKAPRRAKRGSIQKLKNKKTGVCSVCNGKMCRIFTPYQKDYQISLFPT